MSTDTETAPPKTGRATCAQARAFLAVGDKKLDRWLEEGRFTVQRDGSGRTAPRYLLWQELHAFLEANTAPGRGFEAVAQLRARRKRGPR